jgi:hypothetical protein
VSRRGIRLVRLQDWVWVWVLLLRQFWQCLFRWELGIGARGRQCVVVLYRSVPSTKSDRLKIVAFSIAMAFGFGNFGGEGVGVSI